MGASVKGRRMPGRAGRAGMQLHGLVEGLGSLDALDAVAAPTAKVVKKLVGKGRVKNALSGTWLGHPFHPLLTDIPIGSFTSASVLHLIGGRSSDEAADALLALGLVSSVPTAVAGAADWSETYGADQRVGVVHALANLFGVAFYGAALVARRRGRRGAGTVLGLAGMATMTAGGYLGGSLAYSKGVGVNNAFFEHPPQEWIPVLDEAELSEGEPVKVDVRGASVLLLRSSGEVFAIGSRCSHAGGPLDEGALDAKAATVECPWHQSVFSLADGSVTQGPASVPQVAYDVRAEAGRIEVRQRR